MKKLLLASVALTLIAGSAMAADAPARVYKPKVMKAPIYKAQPIAYLPQAYDWSGMYFGGHIGWGHVTDGFTTTAAGGLLANGAAVKLSSDQFIGGIQAGYNFKLAPNILLGFEGEFTWLTSGYSASVPTLVPGTVLTNSASPDWIATAAGRLGYATNNMMIYAKGGAAWLDSHYSAFTAPVGGTFSSSTTRTGYVVGGGLEYGISTAWSAKVEYAYLDFGTSSYNVALAGPAVATAVKTDMQQVKVGLNYHFNGFGGLSGLVDPVVTKY
jgi:outer membrane immunogenic protein